MVVSSWRSLVVILFNAVWRVVIICCYFQFYCSIIQQFCFWWRDNGCGAGDTSMKLLVTNFDEGFKKMLGKQGYHS